MKAGVFKSQAASLAASMEFVKEIDGRWTEGYGKIKIGIFSEQY